MRMTIITAVAIVLSASTAGAVSQAVKTAWRRLPRLLRQA